MKKLKIQQIDELYLRYGYEIKGDNKIREYLFKESIYFGVDIVPFEKNSDIDKIKQEYYDIGFAIKIRYYVDYEDAELTLFRDFFRTKDVFNNLKLKYSSFTKGLMINLPDHAEYQYIRSPYQFKYYGAENSEVCIHEYTADDDVEDLVSKNLRLILEHEGPLLIVIEAAAGYGKTCTAYEILKELINLECDKLPFFTELSRDRKANLFSHILRLEIEEQFANRVNSELVISHIKSGLIPLIIDGFDELIAKDFDFEANQFEKVESMLSTIIDLLSDNAKIVITSRKTAIFNSEEFRNWMQEKEIPYSLVRETIFEPTIENWLDKERHEIVKKSNFELNQISNPVLLSYLRYTDISNLESILIGDKSIVTKYFNFLLEREQERQDLRIDPEAQLQIFRQLVRTFTSLDIKSEDKEIIRDIFIDYHRDTLEKVRMTYPRERKPKLEQLADTLTNHAMLDRKERDTIGIVNDFVLGTLVAESIILKEYELEFGEDYYSQIPQMFAVLAADAFTYQPKSKQLLLWNVFQSKPFNYNQTFFFNIDIKFIGKPIRNYCEVELLNYEIINVHFTNREQFDRVVFDNCKFTNCVFSRQAFRNSSFVQCKFFSCKLVEEETNFSLEYFSIYGGKDNNYFIKRVFESNVVECADEVNIDGEVLKMLFFVGTVKPKHVKLSKIKLELRQYGEKMVANAINKLNNEGLIIIDSDLCTPTKKGINFHKSLLNYGVN